MRNGLRCRSGTPRLACLVRVAEVTLIIAAIQFGIGGVRVLHHDTCDIGSGVP